MRMRRRIFLLTFATLAAALGAPAHSDAQIVGSVSEAISVQITPEFPRPYDTITITPRSSLINLAASTVTISANGAVIEEGSGGLSATYVLGGPGSTATIRVTAATLGKTYSKEVVLRPSDVALVVEPLTTTYPFYDGGSTVAPEGRLRIVAVPDFRTSAGAKIAPSALSYTWKVGSRVLSAESGIGRSVLSATGPLRYRTTDVEVTVSTVDGTRTGLARVSVAPANPQLYVYRDDPLLGVDLANAISGSFAMNAQEETLRAIPFFFGSAPTVSWTLNGQAASAESSLTLRTESSNPGTAAAQVEASDPSGSASASLTVNFNPRKAGGLFGL